MKEKSIPLGIINNNPLNIRFDRKNNWRGLSGENKGFCVFTSEAYGFRAAYKLITNYISKGHNTIKKILNRWAPPTENDTEAYIKFIEYETLIDRNQTLTDKNIHDYWTKIIILRAMAMMDPGRKLDEQQINLYINYPEKFE